jgi:hypothetical protein
MEEPRPSPLSRFTLAGRMLLLAHLLLGIGGSALYICKLIPGFPPGRYPILMFVIPVGLACYFSFLVFARIFWKFGIRVYEDSSNMIHSSQDAIREAERVPVRCDHCAYQAELSNRSRKFDAALISASYLFELQAERELLRRLRNLVSTIPDWEVRFVSPDHVRRAPEFQDALRRDSSLDDFLRDTDFHLAGRIKFVESDVRKREVKLPTDLLRCPSCSEGMIHIELEFFGGLRQHDVIY